MIPSLLHCGASAALPSDRSKPEYREGKEAASAFKGVLQRIIAIPKDELVKREGEYQKRRGVKKGSRPRYGTLNVAARIVLTTVAI